MHQEAPAAASAVEEHTNNELHVRIHHKKNCIAELEIEAYKPLVEAAHKRAVKAIGKEIVVPGFRKGKAPEHMVIKNHGAHIDKQWQEEIANAAYKAAHHLTKIAPINKEATISFKIQSHSHEGAKLTLSFEIAPTIPGVDPKNFQLKEVKRPEVNDQKVDETIRQAQLFYAKWIPITDRPVQEGDFVLLDVVITETTPFEKLFSDTRFEVSDKSMAKWMKELVLGKNAGDSADGVSVPDEDVKPEEKEAFQPKKVRLTIKEIEAADAPELNDEFAMQLGVNNVADLKEQIGKMLEKQADAHVREEQREQAVEFLLSQHPFEIPRSVIEREAQFRMRQLTQDAEFQQEWTRMNQEEQKKLIQSLLAQSEKAVRIFYLCRKIIADAKISLSPKDVPPPATTPLEALISPPGHPHDPRQPDSKQAEAFSRLLLEKAEDWIIANAST